MHADAVIIGGGLHGCSAALHLARVGIKGIVIEQAYPGRHASGVNAGGVRRLGRHPAEVPLSVAAMEIWRNMTEFVGSDCGFRPAGQVKVAEDEGEMARLRERVGALNTSGFFHEEIIDRDELRRLLPAVSGHCVGGLVCRDDGYALPFQTVVAFRERAEAEGARLLMGSPVREVRRQGSLWHVSLEGGAVEAPILVNCAGAWAGAVAAQLGEPVPLRIEAPMLMITERVRPFCGPVVGATGRPLSFKQFENGTVLIGGGHRGRAEPDRQRTHLDFTGLAASAATAREIFPCMEGVRVVRCWAGIEAVMPDEIPVIGPSGTHPGAYHVFGFSAHGFQLGPITGKIIADLVVSGATPLPIEPFSIERFGAGSPQEYAPYPVT